MDERLSAAVIETFVRSTTKGLIYRGKRLVNWDPMLAPAVSDLEVENEEATGTIWQIRYPFSDGRSPTRTAADAGCTSRRRGPRRCSATARVAVHPDDERYRHLIGKLVDAAALRPARSRSSPTTTSTASSAPGA